MKSVPESRSGSFLICWLLLLPLAAQATPSQRVSDGMARLQNAGSDQVSLTLNEATKVVNFLRIEPGAPLQRTAPNRPFDEQTRAFLAEYGAAFGLRDVASELVLVGESTDAYGLGRVHYRQVYRGIPVFGAEVRGLFDRNRELTALSASTFEIDRLDTVPAWPAGQAEALAVEQVSRGLGQRLPVSGSPVSGLRAINTELMVFRPGLARGIAGRNHLAWRVEVVNDGVSVREFVFVDAHSGKVLEQITGILHALDRKVSESSLANVVWEDSAGDPDPLPGGWAGGSAAQTAAWQDEIDGARESYNLFSSMTQGAWLSYDAADATLRTVNNDPQINCPNANWNGISTNYCEGVTGDDTVAHEWGHAYTQYTANLIYAWQPGALNESFSDVWGEVVDFLNGRGTDAPLTARTAGSCSVYGAGPNTDDSYRWLSGEDDPAIGGAIRDMWTPTCYGDPGKVSDGQYWCSTDDGGGVHTNSGVPNHAFALLVDGGSYNSQAIGAVGLLKSAHLFWNTLQLLVPPSDFAQMADALEASCTGLIGVDLPELSTSQPATGLSGTAISAGDCAEVGKAIVAVELRSKPSQCGFGPLLDTSPPARCDGLGALESFAVTDWESGLDGWTASKYDVVNANTFDTPDWAVVGALPDGRTGSAAFVADLIAGDCQSDDETGALALDSPTILIPENAAVPRVSLSHWVATEAGWDGGNLKISVNGGPFTLVPAAAIEVSPYNATLNSVGNGNSNPLAGQPAFTGSDGGSLGGSWGQSQVNLWGLAAPGDSIQLRLDFGVDACNGLTGWYVDEVEFYRCAAELPPSLCGNTLPNQAEQCDDGNEEDGDGCSSSCEVESGWECTAAVAATVVPDHSFEEGGAWAAFSTHFGSPVCTVEFCGNGGGSGPSDGTQWVWFGGIIDQNLVEQGSMSQTLAIPAGMTVLTFDLELPVCDSDTDFMDVRIDNQVVFSVNGGDAACGQLGYQTRAVDISAWADGAAHEIKFFSETSSVNGGFSSIFLDRVLMPGRASVCTGIDPAIILRDGFE